MYFAVDWTDRVDFDLMRKNRTARLRQMMQKHGLDALITFRAENIRYMTGMRPLWWPISFLTRNASVMAQKGEPVLYVTSGDCERCRATMTWLPPEEGVVLQPGMVFSIEPYDGKPGIGGVRLEDNVVVTENGYEVISKYPFEEKLMR